MCMLSIHRRIYEFPSEWNQEGLVWKVNSAYVVEIDLIMGVLALSYLDIEPLNDPSQHVRILQIRLNRHP